MAGFVINFDISTIPNAETLAAFLMEEPHKTGHEYCDTSAKNKEKISSFATQLGQADHVWLVGHGLKDTASIVDINGNPIVHIKDVVDALYKLGVREIIDTCCAPKTRALSVLWNQSGMKWHNLNYYCKSELEKTATGIGTAKNSSVYHWYLQEKIGLWSSFTSKFPPKLPGKK